MSHASAVRRLAAGLIVASSLAAGAPAAVSAAPAADRAGDRAASGVEPKGGKSLEGRKDAAVGHEERTVTVRAQGRKN